jgi:hypothetical protein
MKKSTFVVPPEIRRLLGPAPVLSSEDPNRFEEMLNHFAQCYQPKNALEWSRVWTQTVSAWKLQRLTRYDTQVQESLHKKVVEEAERARAKRAEEEHNNRELDRMFDRYERARQALWIARAAKADAKVAGTNTQLPSDIPLLSGPPLRQAKQRLLSRILRKPSLGSYVQRHGITRDHFRDNPEWEEAFDMMRNGADIQAHVVKNPTSEIARLWQSAEEMRAGETLSLASQIMASVRAEAAAANVTETALKSSEAVELEDGDQPQSDRMDVETMSAKAVPAQPETQKVTTETANKPVALTELAAELDYASVLPQYTPLLLELDRLITAEQKRFDIVPAQIAFERGCLALVLQDAPSDLLEGEFTKLPIAGEVDQLPSTAHASAPGQSAIGSAPHQPPLIAVTAAVSSTVVAPVVALSSPLSVELRVPDSQDDDSSEHLERAGGQVPSTDENSGGRALHSVSPPGMLQATEDELDSPAASAAKTGTAPREDTDPLRKLS